jgi:hypothetical protein
MEKTNPLNSSGGNGNPDSFEARLWEVNEVIEANRFRWRLNSISWMDYEDVAQQLRIHVFNKWAMWDTARPLRPWVSRLVINQIINMIRNNYTIYARPCVTCKWNQGGNLCELYGEQSSDCGIYAKWETGKKTAFEINHAASIQGSSSSSAFDEHKSSSSHSNSNEFYQIEDENNSFADMDGMIKEVHEKLKGRLNKVQWKAYNLLYVDHLDEEKVAQALGYHTNEYKRSPGYKQIKNLKKQIVQAVREILGE